VVAYDSRVVYQFAEGLYDRAKQLVVTYSITGGLVGLLVAGFGVGLALRYNGDASSVEFVPLPGIIGAVLGALAGFRSAQARAFALRLQAQLALCQVKVEENTRPVPQGQAQAEGVRPAGPVPAGEATERK
jgi:hypothetical protein